MSRVAWQRNTSLEEGSILILTLCVLALLSIMAYGLITRVRLGLRQEQWIAASSEANLMLRALAAHAIDGMRKDTDKDMDSYKEAWARPVRFDSQTALADYEGLSSKDHAFILSAGVVDECGKFNVNQLTRGSLVPIVLAAGGGPESADIADAIVQWRTPESEESSDADYYEAQQPPYHPPRKDYKSVDELLLVRGVTESLFFGEDANHNALLDPSEDDMDVLPPTDNGDSTLQLGLSGLLTPYGDGSINVNTAPEAVLRIELRDTMPIEVDADRLSDALLKHRRGPDGIDGTDDDDPFDSEAKLVAFATSVLGEDRAAEAALAVRELGVTSEFFRFILSVEIPDLHVVRTAEMVVSREDNECRLLEWHDL